MLLIILVSKGDNVLNEDIMYNNPFTYIHERKTTSLQQKNGVYYITFPKLEKYNNRMIHAFSTRKGGVSEGYLSEMNLSFTRGDDRKKVLENHRIFANAVGYDENRLVFSDQVHDTVIYKVTEKDIGKGIHRESDIRSIDGLVTNEIDIPIITFYADCVPLFFFDPKQNVIAVSHSGWKGTIKKIGKKMVEFMSSEYGSCPSDIVCAIGPSICQNCYEVSEDVAEQFRIHFGEKCNSELIYGTKPGKYQLNLHQACLLTLLEAGVIRENIDVTDLCTCCNPDWLFSHRKTDGKRGNLAAVMMLKRI